MKIFNKYILGSLLFGAATLSLTSCDLDEYNPSGQGADEVFATPQGMEYLVNQMYYNFRWKYYGREDPVLYMEGSADIWQNIANSASNYEYGMQMTRCVNLAGDRGQIANVWNRVYDNINDANAVINRIKNVVWTPEDEAKKVPQDFEGEARFMRSYCYWWLVEFFGDIEKRTEETSSPTFSAVRTDRKVIYDEVIIPDAKKAAELLPVNPYNGNVGRSTKKAAKALLARVLLTRAQYEAQGSNEQKKFYEQARDAALDVINSKSALGIKLYNTYDEIWQAKNNKTNTEYLWVTSFAENSALDADSKPNRLHMYFSPILVDQAGIQNFYTTTLASWEYPKEGAKLMPSYYFTQLWEDWDLRYDVIFQEDFNELRRANGTYTWVESMASRFSTDPEIVSTLVGKQVKSGQPVLKFTKSHISRAEKLEYAKKGVAVVDVDMLYNTSDITALGGARVRNHIANYGPVDPTTTSYIAGSFPRFQKYRIYDKTDANGTKLLSDPTGQFGFADVPVMRYAEMPLIAAECYIGLGDAGAAADIINKEIRNARIVKPGHDINEAKVKASQMTIDWIMEERARELCGEWLRWFDMKRVYGSQGKFASTIVGRNPSMRNDDNARQEFNTLWPIPNTFLDKLTNADEFGQNPGYSYGTK